MSRIAIPNLDDVPEGSKENLAAVHAQLGVVPNLFRLIGSSPAVLGGFLGFSGALKTTFDLKTRERIALAVAQANGCDYCLSAHSYIGMNLAKLTPEEIAQNRNGRSGDARADAAVVFARKVTVEHGHVSEADLANVRAAGFRDSEIVEIIALVAENSFTNYLNEVAKTDIDFPVVLAGELEEAA